MNSKKKESCLKILGYEKAFLWIGVAAMALLICGTSYASGGLSVSHALIGYTDNGPTVTLDFSLDIVNNGDVPLTDAEILIAPVGPANRVLEPLPSESSVYIGSIPASTGGILVDYTIESIFMLPENEISSFPLFWKIKYTDEAGQLQLILVESQPAASL